MANPRTPPRGSLATAAGRRLRNPAAHEAWRATEVAPDQVECLLCRRALGAVTVRHLRNIHGFDGPHPIRDYKARFGLEVACSRSTRRRFRRGITAYHASEGRHWPRERVVAELQRLARAGKSLAPSAIGRRMMQRIYRVFGTYDRAMHRAGLDPAAHLRNHHWDRDEVTRRVRERMARGLSICASDVMRDDYRLYHAAIRLVRNWGNALRGAGFSPAEHRKPKKWTLEIARDRVLALKARGHPVTLSRIPSGLAQFILRRFGRWVAFLQTLGIDVEVHRLDWTREDVLDVIRDRRARGLPLNRKAVAREGQAVVHQACVFFGSWDGALRAAGVDPLSVRLARTWTKTDVVAGIRARHAAGKPMHRRACHDEEPRLVKAAQKFFGMSWADALAGAGLDSRLADRRRCGVLRRRHA